VNNELKRMQNKVVTPHLKSHTRVCLERVGETKKVLVKLVSVVAKI
jgi:hypothetical protein